MAIGIGEIALFLIILSALGYLLLRLKRAFTRPTDCGCGACTSHPSATKTPSLK